MEVQLQEQGRSQVQLGNEGGVGGSDAPLVVYHRADYDGVFCREIARKFLPPGTEFIGWDYGDETSSLLYAARPERQVYLLDISVPELMGHPRLTWIDHHKSAMEKYLADFGPEATGRIAYCIDGVAACRLAWQFFTALNSFVGIYHLPRLEDYKRRLVAEPIAVTLAGEYDVWDHEKSAGKDIDFQFGLDAQEDLRWHFLLHGDTESAYCLDILRAGRVARACFAKREGDVVRGRSFVAEFEGLRFLCLNTARANSTTFAALDSEATGHEALMAFYWNGREWSVSMYHAAHRKDLDLSLIAVKYGGGGHRGACGFRVKAEGGAALPFVQQP